MEVYKVPESWGTRSNAVPETAHKKYVRQVFLTISEDYGEDLDGELFDWRSEIMRRFF